MNSPRLGLPILLLSAAPAASAQCEYAELVASDGAPGGRFGGAIALAGGRALIGSSELASGGAAYVVDVQTGAELLRLAPSDLEPTDLFGAAVATDGQLAVVSSLLDDDAAKDAGAAYVFDLDTGAELAKLVPPDGALGDLFGISVAVGGGRICVGADGDDDGAANSGSIYVFDAGTGQLLAKLGADVPVADGRLGGSLALEGSALVAGAWNEAVAGDTARGAAYVFELQTYTQTQRLVASDGNAYDYFGDCVATARGVALVGAPRTEDQGSNSGAVYRFDLATGAELGKLLPNGGAPGDYFGESVATDGVVAAVGAPFRNGDALDDGAVYLFNLQTGQYLLRLEAAAGAATDHLGFAVGVAGLRVLGGAPRRATLGAEAGAVHLFAIAGADCNGNGASDPCELAAGTAVDVDLDGVPDDCQGGPLWLRSPVNGRWYTLLPAGEWIAHELAARAWGGHLAAVRSADELAWLRERFPHRTLHIGYTDAATEGLFGWIGGDPAGFESWASGEPDDAPGPFGADYAHFDPLSGLWRDEPEKTEAVGLVEVVSDDCDGNGLPDVYELASGVGDDWNGDGVLDACDPATYCVANPNSSGDAAFMDPAGSPLVAENDLTLVARDLPADRFGYFLFSASTDFVPLFGGGDGNLCLGPTIHRLSTPPTGEVGQSGPDGVLAFHPDLTNMPAGIVIGAGEVWYFQCWFRDVTGGGPTSNTSDGIEILFR